MRPLSYLLLASSFVFFAGVGCSKKSNPTQGGDSGDPGKGTPGNNATPVAANLKVLSPRAKFKADFAKQEPGKTEVTRLALNPNGSRIIVSNNSNKQTQVWNVRGEPALLASLKGYVKGVSDDGAALLSEGLGMGQSLDLETGKPVDRVFVGSSVEDSSSAFVGFLQTPTERLTWVRPDNSAPPGPLRLYRYEEPSGKAAGTVDAGDGTRIWFAPLIKRGQELPIAQPESNKVRVFDFSTKTTTRECTLSNPREFRGMGHIAWSGFTVSSDGKWIAAKREYLAKDPDPVEIFDASGAQVAMLPPRAVAEYLGKFLHGRDLYVAPHVWKDPSFQSGDIAVYDIKQKAFVATLRWDANVVSRVGLSSDGKVLAAGATNGAVAVWDLTQLP